MEDLQAGNLPTRGALKDRLQSNGTQLRQPSTLLAANNTECVFFEHSAERVASFTCSFGAADRGTYTIVGTRGTLTMDPAYEYAEGLAYEMKAGGRTRKKQFGKSDQFAPELLYFSDCVLNNRDPEPSGEEGLADVRVIGGMSRPIRTGRWVKIGVQQRKPRPTLKQAIRRPAIKREPKLVNAEAASR
jgi:predicted dehydrogenase